MTPGVDGDTSYCFGSSNGAALCHYTAATAGLFSGIGTEVSTLDEGDAPDPALPKVSVVQMMNFKDKLIPYEGGDSPTGHVYMSAEDGAAAWAAHNGCDPEPDSSENDEPYRLTLTYSGCDEDRVVIHMGVMPIPWSEACEAMGPEPAEPGTCGGTHSVSSDHFETPGGPWRFAFDHLSGAL